MRCHPGLPIAEGRGQALIALAGKHESIRVTLCLEKFLFDLFATQITSSVRRAGRGPCPRQLAGKASPPDLARSFGGAAAGTHPPAARRACRCRRRRHHPQPTACVVTAARDATLAGPHHSPLPPATPPAAGRPQLQRLGRSATQAFVLSSGGPRRPHRPPPWRCITSCGATPRGTRGAATCAGRWAAARCLLAAGVCGTVQPLSTLLTVPCCWRGNVRGRGEQLGVARLDTASAAGPPL
jgi:hypothetical protein